MVKYNITDGTELSKWNPILYFILNCLEPQKGKGLPRVKQKGGDRNIKQSLLLKVGGYYDRKRYSISGTSIRMVNDFIYRLILHELYTFIELNNLRIDQSIREYLSFYNLTEEELAFETLKKSYQRFIKKRETLDAVGLEKISAKTVLTN